MSVNASEFQLQSMFEPRIVQLSNNDTAVEIGYDWEGLIVYTREGGYRKYHLIDGQLTHFHESLHNPGGLVLFPKTVPEMNILVYKELSKAYPGWVQHGLTGDMTWVAQNETTILLPNNGKLEITNLLSKNN